GARHASLSERAAGGRKGNFRAAVGGSAVGGRRSAVRVRSHNVLVPLRMIAPTARPGRLTVLVGSHTVSGNLHRVSGQCLYNSNAPSVTPISNSPMTPSRAGKSNALSAPRWLELRPKRLSTLRARRPPRGLAASLMTNLEVRMRTESEKR